MSEAREVIIRPIVTEKTMKDYDNFGKVTFQVKKGCNRTQVKQAVEEIFNVKVDRVNMVNVRPKKKRVGKYVGKTNSMTKAIVKLQPGHQLELFSQQP